MEIKEIENCEVIKSGVKEGVGKPLTEVLNNKVYCQGYQKSDSDDEPYFECMNCHLNIFYET